MIGVEALVRWQHPVRGLLYPDRFLPLAEHSGLIVPLTMLVLERRCSRSARWRDDGPAPERRGQHLARATSPTSSCPAQVQALLDAEGLPGSVLTFEVTENSIMSDPARAGEVLRRAPRAWASACRIDDFGTGYSSLAYLRDLSVTEVKIDKTFVDEREHEPARPGHRQGGRRPRPQPGPAGGGRRHRGHHDSRLDGAERLRHPAGLSHPAACTCR